MNTNKPPIGIALLSSLWLFLGLIGFIAVLFLLGTWEPQSGPDAAGNIPVPLLAAQLALSVILILSASYGMSHGATWAWYLGTFLVIGGILRNALGLLNIEDVAALATREVGAPHTYLKYSIGLSVGVLVFAYFFKANVREYFRLTNKPLMRAVLIELFVCVGVTTIFTIAGRMY